MRVTVVGLGYVGLVTAACLSEWGHDVTGVEATDARRNALLAGRLPFHEPGLTELVTATRSSGRLRIAADAEAAQAAYRNAQVVIVAVGTHDGNGGWQTNTILACLAEIVPQLADDAVLVVRSTLPPEFVARLSDVVREAGRDRAPLRVLLNPEFTREGSAITDFMHPDRVIIGVVDDEDGNGEARIREMYKLTEAPILTMSGIDAAFAKLGSNLFLATKISFANDLARLCALYGADVEAVVGGMALDARIGGSFLRAGVGFGGSCLPNQVTMTTEAAARHGIDVPLLAAVDVINHRQRELFVKMVADSLEGHVSGKRIALLGLSFKPNTDDLRDAPALTIAKRLLALGAKPVAYDPMPTARVRAAEIVPGLETTDSLADALAGASVAGLITEWSEFAQIDWIDAAEKMSDRIVVDGRNALDGEALLAAGFRYFSFGRRSSTTSNAATRIAYEVGGAPLTVDVKVHA